MEKTHFVYKTYLKIPSVVADPENGIEGKDEETIEQYNSFDIDRVIRVITVEDKMLVLLDDLHERYEDRPKTHPKTGAPKFDRKGEMIFERVRDTFQSEIFLTKEEGMELLTLIGINKFLT